MARGLGLRRGCLRVRAGSNPDSGDGQTEAASRSAALIRVPAEQPRWRGATAQAPRRRLALRGGRAFASAGGLAKGAGKPA
jgi:hypothetical protein